MALSSKFVVVLAAVATASVLAHGRASAQATQPAARTTPAVSPAREARLIVTVVDPSNAIVADATVTVIGLDAAAKAATPKPGKTDARGVFTATGLPPGRYSIQAEYPGFELGLVRDATIRTGDNKHVVILPLKGMKDSVTVTAAGQDAASSRSGTSFGTTLTKDEIDALSDDPTELARQINDMVGAGAVIRVDSFEGADLPPKSQIKSIHVTRDQFAAETAYPGNTFVDIITQAGVGPIRGTANLNLQNSNWNAVSPFVQTKAEQQNTSLSGNFGGTLVKNKADFSLNFGMRDGYSLPTINANLPNGRVSQVVDLRQTYNAAFGSGLFNWAITRNQTLRLAYNQNNSTNDNLGVGAYDLPGRAYTNDWSYHNFRIQEAGPIGRRFFINTRLNIYSWSDGYRSATDAQTVIVQDEFTSGGAQQRGTTKQMGYTLASDMDYVRGMNSWRWGVQIDGSRYHSDQQTNYLGTFTFANLDAFNAGTPLFYTREIGDPRIAFSMVQGAAYFQDDVRVSKALTFSPGVRYSIQQYVHDYLGIEPRMGMTWAPFKSGKTTLRVSTGLFHGFLGSYIYGQTVRYDGTHYLQLTIANPGFPDAGDGGTVPADSRYLLGDVKLNKNLRHSAGIDQAITPKLRVSFIYAYMHQEAMPRGNNLNAPVDGVRPNPRYANIIESVTDGEIRRHDFNGTLSYNLSPGGAAGSRGKFNWRRLTINGQFARIQGQRNVLNAFDVPPSGTLDTEWGPVPAATPWQTNLNITSTQVRDLTISSNFNARGDFVYTETTGFDNNHDSLLNDRPAGVGLNSLRRPGPRNFNLRMQYQRAVGSAPSGATQGAAAPGSAAAARYRVGLFVNINNLTNHYNYTGYSGVIVSSNYQKATAVMNPRSVNMGMTFSF
jgi:hypothetical protein